MLESKGKTHMVDEPSHVIQLSLIHMCKIGLIKQFIVDKFWSKIFIYVQLAILFRFLWCFYLNFSPKKGKTADTMQV